ncbi:MAG: carbamoyltransferase HypF [Chromatiales bacterium]|nr:carbamoyltransferase HypF [Chromatiales bacterium]
MRRLRFELHGTVQGIGFRPLVCRWARELGLGGFVFNSGAALLIEAEGPEPALRALEGRLRTPPPQGRVRAMHTRQVPVRGQSGFTIEASECDAQPGAGLLPDLASCPECLAETKAPGDRRFRYPFGSCTRCGPRYSIVESLPWDRSRGSMRTFNPCPECRHEYQDPGNRRHHAETLACPACGPTLALLDARGNRLAGGEPALRSSIEALLQGRIVAVKGLAGFQLWVLASDERAVGRLRARKQRPAKPFAVMFADLEALRQHCDPGAEETVILAGPAAPIVLLTRRQGSATHRIAPSVAPGSPLLGAMLAALPLHQLLLSGLGQPVVATSGNRRGEPVLGDEAQALDALSGIADLFLIHDRPILRPQEDSIVRVISGQPATLRQARGLAPLALGELPGAEGVLALGGHLKASVALGIAGQAVLAPQTGDLDSARARDRHAALLDEFPRLHGIQLRALACDLHPDYFTSRLAAQGGLPVLSVQHHQAHVLATMAEHGLQAPVLGVAFDGSGYGPDGTVWGGEFLAMGPRSFRRHACLRRFRLPGGQKAVREPRRSALGLLHALHGGAGLGPASLPSDGLGDTGRRTLGAMLERGFNSPWTSSVGRLFDAVAALLGLCQVMSYEAEAAMQLEWAALSAGCLDGRGYPFPLRTGEGRCRVVDWGPAISRLITDRDAGRSPGAIAADFHAGLADAILDVALDARARRVVLGGGCFQNRCLTEATIQRLHAAGIEAWWPQQVPANDGGLALGQLAQAAALSRQELH